jgi:phosphoglycerate dehydrogenase-like enzyme
MASSDGSAAALRREEATAMPRVLISVNVNEEQMTRLRAAAPDLDLVSAPGGIALRPPGPLDLMEPTCPTFHPDLDLAALLPTLDAIVAYDLTPDLLAQAPQLRWVQVLHAGVDGVWQPYLAAPEIAVTTVSGTHPIPMTEFVLSLLLYFAKRLGQFREQQARREWRKAVVDELHGATVAIVGYGTIGGALAATLQALGMRVVGVRRTPGDGSPPPELAAIYGPDQLPLALAEARYVVSILPRTPETEGFWNDAAFGLLPRGATFINIGRGRTVDEAALLRALASGHLAGAGLDVFAAEPLPPESPLWEQPNVLVIPHTGSETIHYTDRALEIVADNLRRFAAGEPLRNVIDKRLRY